jgi:hypothetical protein
MKALACLANDSFVLSDSITSALLRGLPSLLGFIGGFFTALFAEPLR